MGRALGGQLTYEATDSAGKLVHAEVRIADSLVMLADSPADRPQFPAMLHLYVPDSDAAHARAVKEGATSVRPPGDTPDGQRRGGVRDAWGNEWWFSSPATGKP